MSRVDPLRGATMPRVDRSWRRNPGPGRKRECSHRRVRDGTGVLEDGPRSGTSTGREPRGNGEESHTHRPSGADSYRRVEQTRRGVERERGGLEDEQLTGQVVRVEGRRRRVRPGSGPPRSRGKVEDRGEVGKEVWVGFFRRDGKWPTRELTH